MSNACGKQDVFVLPHLGLLPIAQYFLNVQLKGKTLNLRMQWEVHTFVLLEKGRNAQLRWTLEDENIA